MEESCPDNPPPRAVSLLYLHNVFKFLITSIAGVNFERNILKQTKEANFVCFSIISYYHRQIAVEHH